MDEHNVARCPHAHECGGCKTQDLPYEQQLIQKEVYLRDLFQGIWDEPIPLDPSPEIWHYRNKIELNFDRMQYEVPPPRDFVRESVLGFKKKGKWYHTLDLTTCLIAPKGTDRLMASIRRWMTAHDLRAWFQKNNDGLLRYLLVREGKHTGDLMVVLISRTGDIPRDSFVDAVRSAIPATSIYHATFDGRADAAYMESLTLLAGEDRIQEKLMIDGRELFFSISPQGFFQTNTLATQVLYGRIRELVKEIKQFIKPNQIILLKGSNGTGLWKLVPIFKNIIQENANAA